MKQYTNSIPMNKVSLFNENKYNFFKDEYINDDDEMVPPHMIIKRRISRRMMTSLICVGYEGALKIINLSQVWDSILRISGFIEM
ncbi:hypothetical protein R3W88_033274 [Solanum pinnatisectum]|uniref:Uncharacterized protein n=1 Tax=Solanum pinnatisectum TaxID=50273 RepID=A0AAV9K3H3_9SOLN|nr:hypothetical protein R3W88_033274 [Solanum pinnatisectum]